MTTRFPAPSVPFPAVALLGLLGFLPGAARAAEGDPTLQKQPLSAPPPPPAKKKGLKEKIVESKKEDLTDAMKKAVALVKSYLPPDPARIQQAKDAGKASVEVVEPSKAVRLSFRDYQLPGDVLAVTMDPATNRLAGIQVTIYLDKPSSPVYLKVTMGTLADGTVYSASTQLEVKAEKVAVNVANTGYKHAN